MSHRLTVSIRLHNDNHKEFFELSASSFAGVTDLADVGAAEGGIRPKSAASEGVVRVDLCRRLLSLLCWWHWRDKVVDDGQAVGGDAVEGVCLVQTPAALRLREQRGRERESGCRTSTEKKEIIKRSRR